MPTNDALTGQTVELLQQLIRNQCVNDGSVASGQEVKTTDVLRTYLQGSGLDLEVYQPDDAPGRASLVARIEGSDAKAPSTAASRGAAPQRASRARILGSANSWLSAAKPALSTSARRAIRRPACGPSGPSSAPAARPTASSPTQTPGLASLLAAPG